jgi:hypothetical protein
MKYDIRMELKSEKSSEVMPLCTVCFRLRILGKIYIMSLRFRFIVYLKNIVMIQISDSSFKTYSKYRNLMKNIFVLLQLYV